MLTHPTLEKLKALRLDAFATAWQAQQQDPALSAVTFDERLGLLVEAEWLARENKRLQTALREAKLRLGQACVEDVDYAPRRELDRVKCPRFRGHRIPFEGRGVHDAQVPRPVPAGVQAAAR